MIWSWQTWHGTIDKHGFDEHGLDELGLDKHIHDKQGLDKHGLDKHGQKGNCSQFGIDFQSCLLQTMNSITRLTLVSTPAWKESPKITCKNIHILSLESFKKTLALGK